MIRAILYPVITAFAYVLCLILGPISVRKEAKFPEGGLLILSNHQSDCDPVFLQAAAWVHIHFMGKRELFEMKGINAFFRFWGGFAVERGTPDKSAIKHAVELLKSGKRVGIFPEGHITETGELDPVLPGSALIVRMAQVPVACCRIQNTRNVIPYGSLIPRPAFRRVKLSFGTPRTFGKDTSNEEICDWVSAEWKRLKR